MLVVHFEGQSTLQANIPQISLPHKLASGPVPNEDYGIDLARRFFSPRIIRNARTVFDYLISKQARRRPGSVTKTLKRNRLILALPELLEQARDSSMDNAALSSYLVKLQAEFTMRLSKVIEDESGTEKADEEVTMELFPERPTLEEPSVEERQQLQEKWEKEERRVMHANFESGRCPSPHTDDEGRKRRRTGVGAKAGLPRRVDRSQIARECRQTESAVSRDGSREPHEESDKIPHAAAEVVDLSSVNSSEREASVASSFDAFINFMEGQQDGPGLVKQSDLTLGDASWEMNDHIPEGLWTPTEPSVNGSSLNDLPYSWSVSPARHTDMSMYTSREMSVREREGSSEGGEVHLKKGQEPSLPQEHAPSSGEGWEGIISSKSVGSQQPIPQVEEFNSVPGTDSSGNLYNHGTYQKKADTELPTLSLDASVSPSDSLAFDESKSSRKDNAAHMAAEMVREKQEDNSHQLTPSHPHIKIEIVAPTSPSSKPPPHDEDKHSVALQLKDEKAF